MIIRENTEEQLIKYVISAANKSVATAGHHPAQFNAALIRCLYCGPLLNKSCFLCFKGMFRMAGGSDVTRTKPLRSLFALVWIQFDPSHTSLNVPSRVPALQL